MPLLLMGMSTQMRVPQPGSLCTSARPPNKRARSTSPRGRTPLRDFGPVKADAIVDDRQHDAAR